MHVLLSFAILVSQIPERPTPGVTDLDQGVPDEPAIQTQSLSENKIFEREDLIPHQEQG
jgi:hypothetical protein